MNKETHIKTNKKGKTNYVCSIACPFLSGLNKNLYVCCLKCSYYDVKEAQCRIPSKKDDLSSDSSCTLLSLLKENKAEEAFDVWKHVKDFHCEIFFEQLTPKQRAKLVAMRI